MAKPAWYSPRPQGEKIVDAKRDHFVVSMYLQPTWVRALVWSAPRKLTRKPLISPVNRVRQSLTTGFVSTFGMLFQVAPPQLLHFAAIVSIPHPTE